MSPSCVISSTNAFHVGFIVCVFNLDTCEYHVISCSTVIGCIVGPILFGLDHQVI